MKKHIPTTNDAGKSKVDRATVKLKIDRQDVTIPTLARVESAIDIVYTPASPFAPDVQHTCSITSKDAVGNTVGSDGKFKLQYGLLKASEKVTTDTTKPGFIWRVFQNGLNQDNSNARTGRTFAGELGLSHEADPNAGGAAFAPGKTLTRPAALIELEVDGVIDFSQTADEANGNFTPDLQMPGIPGFEGRTDRIAGKITTDIELPKGVVTMGVNSDDPFLAEASSGNDALSPVRLGEFNGGRGAADSTYTFYVEETGVYPFRTTCEEGGGGANVEWFSVKADGAKVLFSVSGIGGIKADRAAATPADPYVRSVSPTPGANNPGWLLLEAGGLSEGDWNPMTKAAANDSMTVTIWQKNNANINSSSFWAIGPGFNRAFQLHIPWSDGTIYFDTTGEREASDALFGLKVPVAGVYPFRLIWYEGGGGANAEWFTVDKSGKKILVNSTTDGAIKPYKTTTRTAAPSARPTLSLARASTGIKLTFSGVAGCNPLRPSLARSWMLPARPARPTLRQRPPRGSTPWPHQPRSLS